MIRWIRGFIRGWREHRRREAYRKRLGPLYDIAVAELAAIYADYDRLGIKPP